MKTSFEKQLPSCKVQNILIRYSRSNKVKFNSAYQHPEASYMIKYSPKYYRSLTLQVTRQNTLLSKVKKIKKLRRFTGLFKDHLPQKLWFNLLANSRKEIEEIPEIVCTTSQIKPRKPFRKWLNLQKLKFFLNITRLSFPRRRVDHKINCFDSFLPIKKSFIKYLKNTRELKSLEIFLKENHYDKRKEVIEELNGMSRFLNKLEILSIDIETRQINIQELFQNKHVFSQVTILNLSVKFDPVFGSILESCKNLKALSFDFQNVSGQKPEFLLFLTSIQNLPKLIHLEFAWPGELNQLWTHFKPRSSLRYLKISFDGLFGEDIHMNEPNDLIKHWDYIKELDELGLDISCYQAEDIIFMKKFITAILKKIQKVHSLKIWIDTPLLSDASVTYEPFFIENVSHLYESLERFEHVLHNWSPDDFTKFDLNMLKPFRNLKELKLDGNCAFYANIDKAVGLLEENQKEGEYPVLELKLGAREELEWLRNTLKKIGAVKRVDRNLRILISLTFETGDFVGLLEGLCCAMESVKTIKGLVICLSLIDRDDASLIPEGEIRETLGKYKRIRNFMIEFGNCYQLVEYIRIDGEKEQFFFDTV